MVKVGTTSVSVASVATVASAVALPSALKTASRVRSAPTSSERPRMPFIVIIAAANTVSRAEPRGFPGPPETMSVTMSPDLDDRHRDREQQRAERLADPVRHHLGVVHGGEHRAGEQQPGDDQHDRARMAAERDDRDQGRGGGHRGGPRLHHRSPRSTPIASARLAPLDEHELARAPGRIQSAHTRVYRGRPGAMIR